MDIEVTAIIDMAEEMIGNQREDLETSWQVHEGRLTKMNSKVVTITESLKSTLREEVLGVFCDQEGVLQKNISRQQSLNEQTKENWIQVILKRGVEGDQQTREDIDKMSKTQETKTKEQSAAEAETFLTFAVLGSPIRVIDVESAKQDANSLSAIQFESYTLDTGGARTLHPNYVH